MTARLLVVGVGNRDRGDDAAGPTVCDRLDRLGLPLIATRVVETGGADLLHAWTSEDDVVVVDAAAPSGRPGRVTRFESPDEVPAASTALSTHAVDVSAWLELGGLVDMLPQHLELIAIEGCEFTHGASLSEHVERAVDEVVDLIVAHAGGAKRPSALPGHR